MFLIAWPQNDKNNYFDLDLHASVLWDRDVGYYLYLLHDWSKSTLNKQVNGTASQAQDHSNYTQILEKPLLLLISKSI